jgi:hypothetical protein
MDCKKRRKKGFDPKFTVDLEATLELFDIIFGLRVLIYHASKKEFSTSNSFEEQWTSEGTEQL